MNRGNYRSLAAGPRSLSACDGGVACRALTVAAKYERTHHALDAQPLARLRPVPPLRQQRLAANHVVWHIGESDALAERRGGFSDGRMGHT